MSNNYKKNPKVKAIRKLSSLIVIMVIVIGIAGVSGVKLKDIHTGYEMFKGMILEMADKIIGGIEVDEAYADTESSEFVNNNINIDYTRVINNVASSLEGLNTMSNNSSSIEIKVGDKDVDIDSIIEVLDKYENNLFNNVIYVKHNNKIINIHYRNIISGIIYKVDDKEFSYKESLVEYLMQKLVVKKLTGYSQYTVTSGSSIIDSEGTDIVNLDISIEYNSDSIAREVIKLKEYDTKAKNAKLSLNGSKKKFKITGGNNGYKLNLDKTIKRIENGIRNKPGTYIIKAISDRSVPDVKKKLLLGIKKKNVVSHYSTYYGNSDKNRKKNIKTAVNKINGTVLLPGEEFSFNRITGVRSKENGYVKSGTYIDGKMTREYGGGTSQVATTLYNTILKCGIVPKERYEHTIPVGYVPKGQDATVVYGYKDLVFKNTTDTPIVIEGIADGEDCSFRIYGNKRTINGYKYKLQNKRLSNSVVKTYMLKYKNNKLKSKKVVSISRYKEKELVLK